ncbi:hypothetical protein BDV34DRAFT_220577 [Aspergillus parasiticus]|uniref:Uncharacterized protein n=1 Tax=Aspergillus parasiticus TaxID=5067 RepID=A0A5N6E225_ASPPA|nr:hypothetical protein BDV34DRAFT_220577 [Aspergillus parasiticus]
MPLPSNTCVQGAALRGLEGLQSTTKRCRRYYGFDWAISFREGIDDEVNSYIHPYTGEKMVRGIMKWMIVKVGTGSALLNISPMHFPDVNIEKGEKYTENYTTHVNIWRTHYESWSLKKRDTFYACDDTQAPERVGQIVVDFSNVDLSRFESKTVDGEHLYSLSYKLKVIFGAQEGILQFEAVSQGQTIGTTSINFNTLKYY